MLKKAADELLRGESAELGLASFGGAVTEGDPSICQFHDAIVADGDAKDVWSQVLQGGLSVTNGLTMHDPILFPHSGWNLCVAGGLLESVAEFGAKNDGESLHREEELFPGRSPSLAVSCYSPGRDKIMQMRMIGQVTAPRMQNANHANLPADKAGVTG